MNKRIAKKIVNGDWWRYGNVQADRAEILVSRALKWSKVRLKSLRASHVRKFDVRVGNDFFVKLAEKHRVESLRKAGYTEWPVPCCSMKVLVKDGCLHEGPREGCAIEGCHDKKNARGTSVYLHVEEFFKHGCGQDLVMRKVAGEWKIEKVHN